MDKYIAHDMKVKTMATAVLTELRKGILSSEFFTISSALILQTESNYWCA